MPSETLSPLAQAVADLHTRLAELRQRPDVVFITDEVGAPAPAGLLAPYRAQPAQWPAELLDFYALLNGIRVEWRFAGGAKGGYLDIPPLTADGYAETVQWKTSARVRRSVLLLSRTRSLPAWGAWLVGEAGSWAQLRLVYGTLESALFEGPVVPTLADFVQQTAAAYLAEGSLIDATHRAEVLRKLDTRGQPAQPIGAGCRVQLNLEWSDYSTPSYRRAEVLDLHTVAPYSQAASKLRRDAPPTFALLRLDQGAKLVWWPLEKLSVAPHDLYERYHTDPEALLLLGETAGWPALLRVLAQLYGPAKGRSNEFGIGADEYAALLGQLSLTETFVLTTQLVQGFGPALEQLPDTVTLDEEEQHQTFQRDRWLEHNRSYSAANAWLMHQQNIIWILLSGALLRVLYEPAARRRELPLALVNQLEAAYLAGMPTWDDTIFWVPVKTFFNDMRKLRLNNRPQIREPYLSLGLPHPDLPGGHSVRFRDY